MSDLRVHHGLQLTAMSASVEAATGLAPGKAIVLGEHVVLYGAPALAIPVTGRSVRVQARFEPGPWACEASLRPLLTAMVTRLGLDPARLALGVAHDLPLGVGLGGSASLAVALTRALAGRLGATDTEAVRRHAHDLEHLAHGEPSGLDDAVVAYGAPVWLRRGSPPKILPAPPAAWRWWIATTPVHGTTRQAIAHVAAWRAAHRARFDAMVASACADADVARQLLTAPDADVATMGPLLDAAHERLAAIGLSTPALERLMAAAREAGAAGAKLTGAGLGGAALILAPDARDLRPVLRDAGAVEVFVA